MLKMDLEYVKEILFVRLDGTLSRRTAYKINNYLVPIIKKHQIKNLIYNFQDLKSIDETGIDAILNTKCLIKRNKGKICLCEVAKEISLKLKRLHITQTTSEKEAQKRLEV